MKINTKYFGEMEYELSEVITFPEGLFGFEDEKEYLLIRFDNDNGTLLSLQSIKSPGLAFVVVNPFMLMADYAPDISDADAEFIGAERPEQVAVYCIAVVGEDIAGTSINLKAPLVINAENARGRQVILDDPNLSFKHFLQPKAE